MASQTRHGAIAVFPRVQLSDHHVFFFNGRLLSWSLISGGSIPLVVVEACRMEWGRVCPGLFSLKGWFFVAFEIQE